MRILSNFYYVTNILHLHIYDNETAALLFFFLKFAQICILFLYFFQNESNITTSLLMIHSKCTIVHYTNLNSSSKNKPFLNYGLLNILFCFLRFLIYLYFILSKNLWNNYYFLIQISKIHFKINILQNIRMWNLVILKCDANAKFEKMAPFL